VKKYLFVLTTVLLLALAAKNLVRGRVGRAFMAIRDMDIAAEIIGIRPLRTKLLAFAISSFYCGIAGALWAFIYTGGVEALAFDIDRSFQILFMIIIGGLGSILGSFLGAGFIVLLPLLIENIPRFLGLNIPVNITSNVQSMIFGALIIGFLIVEPRGLARLWQVGKEKLRTWPFPY
jgi:branched-chain amino acid transport system permease protein